MKAFILITVLALSQAQLNSDTVSQPPWTGPIADHQIGIHPSDTAEVSAAKIQHLKAFQDVLSVLPELPSEERYIMHELPLPAVRALQDQAHHQLDYVRQIQPIIQSQTPHIQPVMPVVSISKIQQQVPTTPVVPTVLAEEIPRSPIGEVPEVHAARVAHLKAVQEARDNLPPQVV